LEGILKMSLNENMVLAVALFILLFGGGVLVLNGLTIRRERKEALARKQQECVHRWRVVAAPYARQCKICGVAMFSPDENGDFPDGMEEYFDVMAGRVKPPKFGPKASQYHVYTGPDCCGLPVADPIHEWIRGQHE